MRIEEKIPTHLQGLAKLLDRQIEVLEADGDPKTVLTATEQKELKSLGYEDYLAYLKRTRQELGQPEDLSGD